MDILIEWDPSLGGRYLITGKTKAGRDWLDDYATSDMEWWGKSLILADASDVIEHLDRAGLSRAGSGR